MSRFLAASLLILAERLAAMFFLPLCAEDAYITFHAAIDPAWRIAATSPVWAWITLGDPTTARGLSVMGDIAALWAASRALSAPGFWVFVAWWASPFMLGSVVSGLETHLAACLLVVARYSRWGLLAGALRPDVAAMALMASGKRWRWALAAACVLVLSCLVFMGRLIPSTVGAKLDAYGAHAFTGWYWWMPEAVGWIALAIVIVSAQRSLYYLAALCPLLLHWAVGTPQFWWYAVPPLAMMVLLVCERIKRPRWALVAVGLLATVLPKQIERGRERVAQEAILWEYGLELMSKNPTGKILLEPAGMIPWINRNLEVVDEVGLVTPRVLAGRDSAGWYYDLIEKEHPTWIVLRGFTMHELKELGKLGSGTSKSQMFRTIQEAQDVLSIYYPQVIPPHRVNDDGTITMGMRSCDLFMMKLRGFGYPTVPASLRAPPPEKSVDAPP